MKLTILYLEASNHVGHQWLVAVEERGPAACVKLVFVDVFKSPRSYRGSGLSNDLME